MGDSPAIFGRGIVLTIRRATIKRAIREKEPPVNEPPVRLRIFLFCGQSAQILM